MPHAGEMTALLDAHSKSSLTSLTHKDFHARTRLYLQCEHHDDTFLPTAFARRAFPHATRNRGSNLRSWTNFPLAASITMQRVLLDLAHHRRTARRPELRPLDSLAPDKPSNRLLHRVGALLFFGGMTEGEPGGALVVARTGTPGLGRSRVWLQSLLLRAVL